MKQRNNTPSTTSEVQRMLSEGYSKKAIIKYLCEENSDLSTGKELLEREVKRLKKEGLPDKQERKIIHFDMDAFYASVEILDNPSLEGLPVVVGGSPQSRAVVCAASYKAREFGVRSAMACSVAKRLCPDAIFLPPRFHRYKEISKKIHEIFGRYTDLIEGISLDEAWLDVTHNKKNIPSATWIAEEIKKAVKEETRLTCSAGVSYNKFLAKIASDEKKPDGIFVITPEDAYGFLQDIEVRKIPGVGKVTQKKLEAFDIRIGKDLHQKSEEFLAEHFGKFGHTLYQIIRGNDMREVVSHRERKSLSVENTFQTDLSYGEELFNELKAILADLDGQLWQKSLQGKTLTLKVKFHNFTQVTRSRTTTDGVYDSDGIRESSHEMLNKVCKDEFPEKEIRLLGVGISNFLGKKERVRRKAGFDLFHQN